MKRVVSMPFGWVAGLAACAVLAGCGGGSQSPAPIEVDVRAQGALVQASSGELLDYAKTVLGKRADQRLLYPAIDQALSQKPPTYGGSATDITAATHSDTTVQETGVDEDDLLKTDGSLLVALERLLTLSPSEPTTAVQLHRRRADGGLDAVATVKLPGEPDVTSAGGGLYYAADLKRVAVLSNAMGLMTLDVCDGATCRPPISQKPSVWVDRIEVGDPAAPVLAERIRIDGRLIGSRRIGRLLIMVTQHSPQLPVELWPANAPQGERDEQIARLKATDLLPTISIGTRAPRLLTSESECFLQPANASLGIDITTITTIDLATDDAITSRCFAGGTEALYMSATNIYLATTRYSYELAAPQAIFPPRTFELAAIFPSRTTTDIHKFALGTGTVDYRGSGEVQGHLGWDMQKRSYRMSEHGGVLRVLTYTAQVGWGAARTEAPPSPAQLSMLRESNTVKRLDVIAHLPNDSRPQSIGKPDEQVYAVRFLGTRGYVVTFRRIDPLYVLDLADPTDPKAVGELQTAGFSDYLFPVDNGLLFAVGADATADGDRTGVKVALFDVADAAKPREIAAQVFGSTGSASGLPLSPHGVNFYSRGGILRVGLPLYEQYVGAAAPAARRGLQRFEINPAARTLATLSMVPPAAASSAFDLGNDRSQQIDDYVYYFSGQRINAVAW